MHLSIILDMAADGLGDRPAFTDPSGTISYTDLRIVAHAVATQLLAGPEGRVVFLGSNSLAVPVTLFASALAGKAFTPLNYRLTDTELRRIAERAAPAVAVVDDEIAGRLDGIEGLRLVTTSRVSEVCAAAIESQADPAEVDADPDAIGVLLFTSGTTGEPKAAVLRHTHLASYVMSTLEYASAGDDEVALVSVPPYHIAGISAVVSSVYTGRQVAYLANFSPQGWVEAVVAHRVTHAMVVPTMLGRVLDEIEAAGVGAAGLAHLRHLSYGGGRMPLEQIERALAMLPATAFVNAYGLTETSSTVSVLGPDDHRDAHGSDDPDVRRRLGSVGRPSEAVEVSIRDERGVEVPVGVSGEIWVRGDQVSGEYVGRDTPSDAGWFHTNDGGHIDAAGYLYVEGRLDDVIVRGGENISPGEIEDVLRRHPAVADVAVLGVPSQEWGERIVAFVVAHVGADPDAAELQQLVRSELRSSRVPEEIHLRAELPYNETGKLLRRLLRAELAEAEGA